MTFSQITIKFLVDFEDNYNLDLIYDNGGSSTETWTWVASRSSGFEVTTGSPTGNAGETTAINFKAAFDLDNPTGYVTTLQNTNEVLIESETEGEDFISFRANDENLVLLTNGVDYEVTFDNFVPTPDVSSLDFMLVRSPHYINTPFNFESTKSSTIQVFEWSGDLSSIPAEPEYTLTKIRPSINYQEFNTNISEFIRDSLDGRPTIVLSSTTQITDSTDAEVKFVKWVASYTDPDRDIPSIENTLVAVEGFGYFPEGVNPTKPASDILTNCELRKVDRTGFILLPFVNNGTITSIDIDSDKGTINANEVITSEENSNKIVQYLSIDVSAATTDNFITVTFNGSSGDPIIYEIVDECRYTPKVVVFKNRYGVYEAMTLFKKSNESINVTSDDFTNAYLSNGAYSTTDHQKQKINIQAMETISCQSGYTYEQENQLYKEAILSDKLFFYEGGNLIPINIKSSSLEFKTRVNDRLVNYQIEFEYAYNTIQNV